MNSIVYFFLLCILFTSCQKYLDKKPSKSLVVPATLTDLQAMLDNNDILNQNAPVLGQVGTDEYYLAEVQFTSMQEKSRSAYLFDSAVFDATSPNDWSYNYRTILPVNYILEKLEEINRTPGNSNEWENISGSAHFYRARGFWHAVNIWAKAYDKNTASNDLGIPLRKSSDFNERSKRASIKESFDAIIEDLNEASRSLPLFSLHPMRPSKLAAWGLLSRTYLAMQIYDSAYKYADLYLTNYSNLINFNSLNINATFPFTRFNTEVIFHSRNTFSYTSVHPNYARIDSLLYRSYADNDLRKSAYFKSNGDGSYSFKGSYDNSVSFFNGIATDEIYLTRAEALVRKNRLIEGLKDLNTLLATRWKNGTFKEFSAANQAEALRLVLDERKKELLFRDLRWMDIKRLNKEGENIIVRRRKGSEIIELLPNDNRYAWPIPQDVIELSGMKQNPR